MSAQPENILPFPNSLEDLVQDYIDAKKTEDAAKKARISAEERILSLQPPREEGSETITLPGGLKLTTTGKLTYKLDDLEALRNITRDWDGNLVPLKATTVLDETGAKWLRANRPELWQQVARVITIAPAKASIKVGV